jgi:hypothetical protein
MYLWNLFSSERKSGPIISLRVIKVSKPLAKEGIRTRG